MSTDTDRSKGSGICVPQFRAADGNAELERLQAAVARVFRSGRYILGEEVHAFEQEFAQYLGVAKVTGVASGTDAIEIALRALSIGAGDLVFVPAFTAGATATGVLRAGARMVLVDVDSGTLTLGPEALEAAIESVREQKPPAAGRPAAVVVVHLYGRPADLPSIVSIAARHGLHVIEDCAQAHGAAIAGRKVGSWGAAGCFSFYPTKNLAALGDGGAVVTNDPALDERARRIRQYGWRERHVTEGPGFNSRLDEVHAAVLRERLARLDTANDRRRQIAERYRSELAGTRVALQPPVPSRTIEVHHQFVIRIAERSLVRERLAEGGVGTAVHYPRALNEQSGFASDVLIPHPLPVSQGAAATVLSLPMYPTMTDAEVDRVCDAVRESLASP